MRLVELSLRAVLQFTEGANFGARAPCKRRCAETPQIVKPLRSVVSLNASTALVAFAL